MGSTGSFALSPVLIVPGTLSPGRVKEDIILPLNLDGALSELLWSIYAEFGRSADVYIADLRDPERVVDTEELPSNTRNILIGRERWGIAIKSLERGSKSATDLHLLVISTEEAKAKVTSIAEQLVNKATLHRAISERVNSINMKVASKIRLKNKTVASIAGIQLFSVIYLSLAVGWDLAEPVSYIIAQVNTSLWLLIFLLTNSTPYASFRDYCVGKYTERLLKAEGIDTGYVGMLYSERRTLTEILRKYRKIVGVKVRQTSEVTSRKGENALSDGTHSMPRL